MKVKNKAVILMTTALLTLTAGCSSQEEKPNDKNPVVSNGKYTNNSFIEESPNEDLELSYLKSKSDTKVNLGKDIQYLQIKEVNNDVLTDTPKGETYNQSVFYDSEKLLYLLFDAEKPTEKTEFITTYEKFNGEYLLDYDLLNTQNSKVSLDAKLDGDFASNNEKVLKPQNRLIDNLSIEKVKDSFKVSANKKQITVGSGETKTIKFSNGNVKTQLVISNNKIKQNKLISQNISKEMKEQINSIKENGGV